MEIRLTSARHLDCSLISRWRELQASNPSLTSPYFSPDYVRAVASARSDVEVASVIDGGEVAAIFSFQRRLSAVAAPVGEGLADFQGLVCAPDFACDPRELLKACGLAAWDFDHLLAEQGSFLPFHAGVEDSHLIDLSGGFEAYVASCPSWKAELRKLRKLERELGSIRFVLHSPNHEDLAQVLSWKSGQYVATGLRDGFAIDWVRQSIERIHEVQSEDFSGVLSLLYAGDRLIAGHMGMRTPSVLHWWFPSYDPDPELRKYSPGLLILLKVAETAASDGVRRIDLGKGQDEFKLRLRNGSTPVATGCVERPSLLMAQRSLKRAVRAAIINSPLETPVRRLARLATRL